MRRNAVAVVIAAALATLLLLGRNSENPATPTLFPELAPMPDSLVIKNDSINFHAVPREGHWWQTRPVADWASDDVVNERLAALSAAVVFRRFQSDSRALGEFGLDPPAAVIFAGNSELQLGGENATADGLFAMVPGSEEILVVGRVLEPFLRLGPGALRSAIPLRIHLPGANEIGVTHGKRSETYRRREHGRWEVTRLGVRGDSRALGRIAVTAVETKIHRFVPKGQYVAGDDEWIITFESNGRVDSVFIGSSLPGTALRVARSSDRPTPFLIPARTADTLNTQLDLAASRAVFDGDPLAAETVVFTSDGVSRTIERSSDGDWVLRGEGALRPAAVRALLRNLAQWSAVAIVPPENPPVEIEATVEITVDSESVVIDLRDREVPLLRRNGERGLLVLPPSLAETIPIDLRDLLAGTPARG